MKESVLSRKDLRCTMGDEGKRDLHLRIITNLLYTLGILLILFLVVPKLFVFFMPLIIAWVIASIANPMVRFLENRVKIMRKHGSVFVIVFILILVGGLLYLGVYATVQQVISLWRDLPGLIDNIVLQLQDSLGELHRRIDIIPENLQDILGKNNEKLEDMIMSAFESLQKKGSLSTVSSMASSVIDGFVLSVLTLMLSYFFVAQREKVKTFFGKCIPQGAKNIWNMALDTCLRALAGYLKACFKIGIIVFLILWFIFGVIIGVKYSALVALVTAFLDFLPFLGTGIIITPWAIYCAITGEYVTVVVLVVAYVITLLAHRLLEPKLIGDSVGMSPFATLISMFICYRMIGMLGLIVGIPIGMILIAFYEQGVFESQIRGIKILAHDINEYRKY